MTDAVAKGTSEAGDLASEMRAARELLTELRDLAREAGQPRPKLLTVDEVAGMLRMSPRLIRKLVSTGSFPPPLQIAALRRWRVKDIDRFLAGKGVWPLGKRRRSSG